MLVAVTEEELMTGDYDEGEVGGVEWFFCDCSRFQRQHI